MRPGSARAPLWASLDATTAGQARSALDIADSLRREMLIGLEALAAAADGLQLTDVVAGVRARVAASDPAVPVDEHRALPPIPGEAWPSLAGALLEVAELTSKGGMFFHAETACRMAMDLYLELEGTPSRSFVVALAKLSTVYARASLVDEAETAASLALKLTQELAAEGSPLDVPDQAVMLLNLATARLQRGRFDDAAEYYGRACALLEPVEAERERYAVALNNLGAANVRRGRWADALASLRKALWLRREVLPPGDPAHAETLMNLGVLALQLQRRAVAGSVFGDALAIRQAAWPNLDHPLVAQSMSSVAAAKASAHDIRAAVPMAEQALSMRRRLFAGVPHTDLAESLNNVAHLRAVEGRFREAIDLWREAVGILNEAVGYDAPDLAGCFSGLAQAYAAVGDLSQARAAAETALLVAEQTIGYGHASMATLLGTRAVVMAMSGDRVEALKSFRQALAVEDSAYWRVTRMSSASDRALYSGGVRSVGDAILSLLVADDVDPTPAELVEVSELVLRRKHVELETRMALRDAIRAHGDPQVAEFAAVLSRARAELVRLELSGPRGVPMEDHEEAVLEAGVAAEQAEMSLAERLPGLDLGRMLADVSFARVQAALPEGAALVEIVRVAEPDLRPGHYGPRTLRDRYIAVVVVPAAGTPSVVALGEAEPIDQMVDAFRAAIVRGESEIGVGAALAGELIVPLLRHLEGLTRVMLAPDGDLFELPFDALPLDDGRRLVDVWEITYLTSGRELLHEDPPARGEQGAPLVIGDPDFDLAGTAARGLPPAFTSEQLGFERLEHTRREAEQVARALGVTPLLGAAARECVVKASHSPRVLHLATHGFFLPAMKPAGVNGGPPAEQSPAGPLLRSGLLLAGARTWCSGGVPPDDAEDGVLTAEDVAGLDLTGTDLVVLSACESGLGVIQTGEGVQGLRSSFQVAGARAVVMSMWKVGDEITADLMGHFYAALGRGASPASALRHSQGILRQKYPDHAFAWASFVCQGAPPTSRARASRPRIPAFSDGLARLFGQNRRR